jgi:PST family polysaccharide transporter
MLDGRHRFYRLLNGHGSPTGDLKTSTVRGGAYAMGAEGLDFVLRVGSAVVLARLLVPEHFGLVSMVMAITTIADRFRDFGLAGATVQRLEISHEQISTLFWINAAWGAFVMLAIMALAYPIAAFYGEPRLIVITLLLGSSFFWHGTASQHDALLRRTMRFGRLATIKIGASALSIAIAIVLAVKGFGYWALVAREVSRNFFMAVGAWMAFPWVPGRPSRQAGIGGMLQFGAEVTGSNLLSAASQSVDQVLIGRLFGAHDLGLYRQGLQLVLSPMNQVVFPVTVITESALSRLQADPPRYRHYYRNILSMLSLGLVPLGIFMAVLAEELVLVLLGPQWIQATPVFRLLAIAAFLQPSVATANGVMTTCGQSRKLFVMGLFTSAALIVFFIAGIPFGPEGIASGHIWALWLLLVPRLYWSFKDTPINLSTFFAAITRPVVATAIMAVVLVGFKWSGIVENPAPRLVLSVMLALVTYFAVWFATRGGRKDLITMILDVGAPLGLTRFLPQWLLRVRE